MRDMIHNDQATLLEVTFESKCTNLYAKHFLWMCVCVYEREKSVYMSW